MSWLFDLHLDFEIQKFSCEKFAWKNWLCTIKFDYRRYPHKFDMDILLKLYILHINLSVQEVLLVAWFCLQTKIILSEIYICASLWGFNMWSGKKATALIYHSTKLMKHEDVWELKRIKSFFLPLTSQESTSKCQLIRVEMLKYQPN